MARSSTSAGRWEIIDSGVQEVLALAWPLREEHVRARPSAQARDKFPFSTLHALNIESLIDRPHGEIRIDAIIRKIRLREPVRDLLRAPGGRPKAVLTTTIPAADPGLYQDPHDITVRAVILAQKGRSVTYLRRWPFRGAWQLLGRLARRQHDTVRCGPIGQRICWRVEELRRNSRQMVEAERTQAHGNWARTPSIPRPEDGLSPSRFRKRTGKRPEGGFRSIRKHPASIAGTNRVPIA